MYKPPAPLTEHSAYNNNPSSCSRVLDLLTPSPFTGDLETTSSPTLTYSPSSMTMTYDDDSSNPRTVETELARDGRKMQKKKSRKGEGLNDALDALLGAHSVLSLSC